MTTAPVNATVLKSLGLSFFLTGLLLAPARAQAPAVVQFFDAGKVRKGITLVEFAQEVVVIGRDGWMHSLNPKDPKTQIKRLNEKYEVASVAELRNQLRAEFGREFDVIATKNFLVVQPKGRGDRWPRLFEQSHRAFTDYMSKRGVNTRVGRFPMVAVVFPDQSAMYAEFKRLNINMSRVAGVYSGESNRVMTHDGGRLSDIAATVRHEAAHQSAFNSNVHSRVNDTPKWISEGIGQMFEPRGMTDARSASRQADRVNRDSESFIKDKYSDPRDSRFSETVMQLISDDTMFKNDRQVREAYAVSWAMMFFLAERQPDAFAKIINHTASRRPFKDYSRAERVREFENIVGVETFEFSKKVMWFLRTL
ncbi:MAG: DUF1570 domain-containing protein [Rubripirellula sp.]